MATSKSKTATAKKPATGKTTTKATSKTATAKKPTTKVSAKTIAKAPAAKKPAAAKTAKTTEKKPAAASKKSTPSPEQRYKMIQEAAYFLAEKNSFAGCSMDYWVTAEAQINVLLSGK
ncbi:MAG: DUF2934 domain-containing protein [Sideroxydans sp.]|nr:DUF2934 domain-containing protein [Sideroxydans sp.]